jgi:hypothetical protein
MASRPTRPTPSASTESPFHHELRPANSNPLGAGRKPNIPGQPGVSHMQRPQLDEWAPVHVRMKIDPGVGNLRRKTLLAPILEALHEGREKDGFRVCHFLVLAARLHLIVEAESTERLARGMQGLSIRIARGVNRVLGRAGRFYQDRYDAKVLANGKDVHRALAFVVSGGGEGGADDGFSSLPWFEDGGMRRSPAAEKLAKKHASPIAPARTRLLASGWRKVGPLGA